MCLRAPVAWQAFIMPVEGTFSIAGRGTVVTGRVESGRVRPGDEIEIVGLKKTQKTTVRAPMHPAVLTSARGQARGCWHGASPSAAARSSEAAEPNHALICPPQRATYAPSQVTGVEMFHKELESGDAGDNVGCLLRGLKRDDVQRGQVLAKPGALKPIKKFDASVYALTKEEGGRHTPFFTNYRPQFFFRTADVTASVTLTEDRQMVMPGDNAEVRSLLRDGRELEAGSGQRAGTAGCDRGWRAAIGGGLELGDG